MITRDQAKVGARVRWQSLDLSIPPAFGTIEAVSDAGEIAIAYDDGEEGTTYVDSGVSTVYPA